MPRLRYLSHQRLELNADEQLSQHTDKLMDSLLLTEYHSGTAGFMMMLVYYLLMPLSRFCTH